MSRSGCCSDALIEERDFLRDDRDLAAENGQIKLASIYAIHRDLSAYRKIVSGDERDRSALPYAGFAD